MYSLLVLALCYLFNDQHQINQNCGPLPELLENANVIEFIRLFKIDKNRIPDTIASTLVDKMAETITLPYSNIPSNEEDYTKWVSHLSSYSAIWTRSVLATSFNETLLLDNFFNSYLTRQLDKNYIMENGIHNYVNTLFGEAIKQSVADVVDAVLDFDFNMFRSQDIQFKITSNDKYIKDVLELKETITLLLFFSQFSAQTNMLMAMMKYQFR